MPQAAMEDQRAIMHHKSPSTSPSILQEPAASPKPPRRERVKSFVKQVVRRVSSTKDGGAHRHRTPSPASSAGSRQELHPDHHHDQQQGEHGEDYFTLQAAASPRSSRSPRHSRVRTMSGNSTASIKSTDSMAQRFRRKMSASTGSSGNTPSLDSRSTVESELGLEEHHHEQPVSLAYPQVVESPEEVGEVAKAPMPTPLLAPVFKAEMEAFTPTSPTPVAPRAPVPLLSPPAEEHEALDPFVMHDDAEIASPRSGDAIAQESSPEPSAPVPSSAPSSSHGPSPSAEISLSPAAPPVALPAVVLPSTSSAPSPLRIATPLPAPSPISPLNVNKDVPAPPEDETSDESSEDLPPLFVPTLVLPQLFLPIPNVRRLLYLWNRHVPPYTSAFSHYTSAVPTGAKWLILPTVLFAVGVMRNHRRA